MTRLAQQERKAHCKIRRPGAARSRPGLVLQVPLIQAPRGTDSTEGCSLKPLLPRSLWPMFCQVLFVTTTLLIIIQKGGGHPLVQTSFYTFVGPPPLVICFVQEGGGDPHPRIHFCFM